MIFLELPKINAGRYVLAVSGGVDSVVLLNLLLKQPGLELVIAHVDHGIREDSRLDAEFVKALAEKHKLTFEQINLNLSANASEETARIGRYKFLNELLQKYKAVGIITAHHQDDVIETAFINLIRGTGHWGLSSLGNTSNLHRPLLDYSKAQILDYAKQNNITWREDSTNTNKTILRNKIRHDIVPRMSAEQRRQILTIIAKAEELNSDIDKELDILLRRGFHKNKMVISRGWFNYLPYDVSKEVTRRLLLKAGARDLAKKNIDLVTVNLKVLPAGKVIQAPGVQIELTKRSARIKSYSKTDKK